MRKKAGRGREYHRKRYAADAEVNRARANEYYRAHREEINARRKAKYRKACEAKWPRNVARAAEERARRKAEEEAYQEKYGKSDAGWAQYTPPSLEKIMHAKEKPEGVSEARWRIEISRRRMVAKARREGRDRDIDFLPHPDLLW